MKRISLVLLMLAMGCLAMALITDFYEAPYQELLEYYEITGTVPAVSGQGYWSDEELTVAIPIGFTFAYCGTSYTEVKMSTNGYLAMGANHSWFYSYENMLSSTNPVYFPILAPLWDDLDCADLRYTTTGSAPNRVFTAQWADAKWDYSGNPGQNFQVKLYETSNLIEFIYGEMATPTNASATIGINMAPGGPGNFYSLSDGPGFTNSTTVEYSNISGAAYLEWSGFVFNPAEASVPNAAVPAYPTNGATSIPVSAVLTWTSGGGLPTGYTLNLGTDGGGTTPPSNLVSNLDLGAQISYDPAGDLLTSTTYYWQVIPYNATGPATGCPIWSFTTGGLPLRGVKTIDPAGSGPDNYISFTAAINDLNSLGVGQDGVFFNVPAGLSFNEPALLPAITATGTSANPIVFIKSGTGSNPIVTVPGTTGATDYVFKLSGVSYVTFDGIDVANATGNTGIEYGYWLAGSTATGGSSFNSIKNCAVNLSRDNVSCLGVFCQALMSVNNNNLFQNITVNNAYNGLHLLGMTSAEDQNNLVVGCTFNSMAERGIYLENQSEIAVFDNLINYPIDGPQAANMYGLFASLVSNCSVYNNAFSGGNVFRSLTNILMVEPAEVEIHHNTISGTVSTAVWYIGINVGLCRWGTVNIHHNNIYDITSGTVNFAIYTMRGYNININDNHVYNISAGAVFWGIHAIENVGLDYPANIYNNHIHNIHLTAETFQMVSGINAQDRFANIYNNMIYDIKAPNTNFDSPAPQVCGISLQDLQPSQGERANVYNNSVLLTATGTSNSSTACFYSSFGGPVDLKNNIFVNNSVPGATGRAVAFWKSGTSFNNFVATMDKNIYYASAPDANHLIYYDGINSSQTLDDYKALNVGKDQGSYWENVPFVSGIAPYDLHINPTVGTNVEGNAIYLPAVLVDDIDGDIRSMTPDIGADEGDFSDFSFLAAPTNVSVMLSGANVQISWDAVAGATGYYIYGADQPDAVIPWGTPLQTVMAPDTTATLSPVGQFKFYYVTAYQ